MSDLVMGKNNFRFLTIAVIVTIFLGLVTSVFFMLINKESYSAIYIIPDSISHDTNDNSVLYTYGVKSSESGTMEYTLRTYLNNSLMKTKEFTLNKGEVLDERDRIVLPVDTIYPSKIRLELSTKTSKEEVHFWLEG